MRRGSRGDADHVRAIGRCRRLPDAREASAQRGLVLGGRVGGARATAGQIVAGDDHVPLRAQSLEERDVHVLGHGEGRECHTLRSARRDAAKVAGRQPRGERGEEEAQVGVPRAGNGLQVELHAVNALVGADPLRGPTRPGHDLRGRQGRQVGRPLLVPIHAPIDDEGQRAVRVLAVLVEAAAHLRRVEGRAAEGIGVDLHIRSIQHDVVDAAGRGGTRVEVGNDAGELGGRLGSRVVVDPDADLRSGDKGLRTHTPTATAASSRQAASSSSSKTHTSSRGMLVLHCRARVERGTLPRGGRSRPLASRAAVSKTKMSMLNSEHSRRAKQRQNRAPPTINGSWRSAGAFGDSASYFSGPRSRVSQLKSSDVLRRPRRPAGRRPSTCRRRRAGPSGGRATAPRPPRAATRRPP